MKYPIKYNCFPNEKLLSKFCKEVSGKGEYNSLNECIDDCMYRKRMGESIIKYNLLDDRVVRREETKREETKDVENLKEIQIKKLKDLGKYDEWADKGSKWGCIARPPLASVYVWANMNNEGVGVNEVTSTFRTDRTCFPVFNWVKTGTMHDLPKYLMEGVPIKIPVDQGKFVIVEKNQTLTTAGLFTCVGFGMIIGNKKFMAHVDATTNIEPIILAIKRTVEEEGIDNSKITNINVWEGIEDPSRHAHKKVYEILERLDIPKEDPRLNIKNVCFMDDVNL